MERFLHRFARRNDNGWKGALDERGCWRFAPASSLIPIQNHHCLFERKREIYSRLLNYFVNNFSFSFFTKFFTAIILLRTAISGKRRTVSHLSPNFVRLTATLEK